MHSWLAESGVGWWPVMQTTPASTWSSRIPVPRIPHFLAAKTWHPCIHGLVGGWKWSMWWWCKRPLQALSSLTFTIYLSGGARCTFGRILAPDTILCRNPCIRWLCHHNFTEDKIFVNFVLSSPKKCTHPCPKYNFMPNPMYRLQLSHSTSKWMQWSTVDNGRTGT